MIKTAFSFHHAIRQTLAGYLVAGWLLVIGLACIPQPVTTLAGKPQTGKTQTGKTQTNRRRVVQKFPAPSDINFGKRGTPVLGYRLIKQLQPIHQRLGKPKPGEWLAEHRENGQTFRQYLRESPITPTGVRNVIYVKPIGDLSKSHQKLVSLSAEYLSIYYGRPVHVLEPLPLESIPKRASRVHPSWGDFQILTTYVLQEVLKPDLRDDAAAYIALTNTDLWPGDGWNFVFGQASLKDRVGVWSMYRNGDPEKSGQFKLCLKRTLKTASHEVGHMFSIRHCTKYHCNMCGSNHRQESDRQPMYLCPECHAKVCWASNADPIARFKRLAEFSRREGLDELGDFFEMSAKRVE